MSRPHILIVFATLTLLFTSRPALALSEQLHDPHLFFPRPYDPQRAKAIDTALHDKQFKFLTGLTSYWEPDFATTLCFAGDTQSLNAMLAQLSTIPGLQLKLTFSKDLSKETGSALQAGSWWIKYRHTAPNTIEIRINESAKDIDKTKIAIPPGRPE